MTTEASGNYTFYSVNSLAYSQTGPNSTDGSVEWSNKWSTFCSAETDQLCADIPLYKCSSCKQYAFWIFFVCMLLLSSWILLGNSLVIAFVYKKDRNKWGVARASLAVADMMTGLLLITVTLPSVIWTVNSTSFEIYLEVQKQRNSAGAITGTIVFIFCISSFMYMLTFMSYHRFAAIKWPIKTKQESNQRIAGKMALVWIGALTTATYTSWFPGSYNFGYFYFTFLYLPNIRISSASHLAIATGTLIPFALSYLLMTSLTVATGVLIRRRVHSKSITSALQRESMPKFEKSSYIMLMLLELAFTVSALPALVAYAFAHAGAGNSVALLVANYLLMSNGSINLIIYWKQDRNFKEYLKGLAKSAHVRASSSIYNITKST